MFECGVNGCNTVRETPYGIKVHRSIHGAARLWPKQKAYPPAARAARSRVPLCRPTWLPFATSDPAEKSLLVDALYDADAACEAPEYMERSNALIVRLESLRRFVARSRREENLLREALSCFAPESDLLAKLWHRPRIDPQTSDSKRHSDADASVE